MAFHTLKNQVILYGGKCNTGTGCSTGFYALTWGWNGSTWTQLSVGGPPGRTGHRLAYDPNLGTTSGLYTFGGQNQTGLLQDTWYLPPLGNWVQCSDTGLCLTKPSLRCCMGLAYDRRNAILTLFGGANCADADTVPCASYFGDTWTFDATGWHCVAGC